MPITCFVSLSTSKQIQNVSYNNVTIYEILNMFISSNCTQPSIAYTQNSSATKATHAHFSNYTTKKPLHSQHSDHTHTKAKQRKPIIKYPKPRSNSQPN